MSYFHIFLQYQQLQNYIYSLLGASNFDRLCRCIMPCSADDDVNFSFYMKKSILCQVVILFVFTIKYMVSFINGGGLQRSVCKGSWVSYIKHDHFCHTTGSYA